MRSNVLWYQLACKTWHRSKICSKKHSLTRSRTMEPTAKQSISRTILVEFSMNWTMSGNSVILCWLLFSNVFNTSIYYVYLSAHMMPLTFLILAVCRTDMIWYELVNGRACHKSLEAQWLEHLTDVWTVLGLIPFRNSDLFFIPCSWHNDYYIFIVFPLVWLWSIIIQ